MSCSFICYIRQPLVWALSGLCRPIGPSGPFTNPSDRSITGVPRGSSSIQPSHILHTWPQKKNKKNLATASPRASSHQASKLSCTPFPSSGPLTKAMSPAYPPRPCSRQPSSLNLPSFLPVSVSFSCLSLFNCVSVHHVACGILVPRPGIEPVSTAVEAPSLNPWTAREVPPSAFPHHPSRRHPFRNPASLLTSSLTRCQLSCFTPSSPVRVSQGHWPSHTAKRSAYFSHASCYVCLHSG